MSDPQKVRELIAQADHERALAAACENVRHQIRLGSRGRIFRTITVFGAVFSGRTTYLSRDASHAVYEALTIVHDRHINRATEIEQKLDTTP